MRIFATILIVVLWASAAQAQSNARGYYGPVSGAHAKVKAKPKTKAARHTKPAAKQPIRAARHHTAPLPKSKPRTKTTARPDAKTKPARAAAKSKVTAVSSKAAAITAATAAPTPAPSSSLREAYDAIPLAERMAIQSDLIWTGDYNGLINGEFSERLVEAVRTYQKRHKDKVTGVPSPQERKALTESAGPRQVEVGWKLVEDPVTGARVGLPAKLATKSAPAPTGTRWSSAQGQLQIETFRIDTGATLDAVFEQQKKQHRRSVTYHVLRPDSFVVSGTQGLKKFYVRAFAKDGEVHGLTILYDQAMEGTMDPIVVAMSSAFVPFASYTIASVSNVVVSRRKVEYGTGVVISPLGHIITARHVVEGCQVLAIPTLGNAERIADDKSSDIALLRIYGLRNAASIGWRAAAGTGEQVTLVGIADPQAQAGGSAVTAVPARLGTKADAMALDPVPSLGFSGAAALDGQGRLVGMAVHRSSVMAGTAAAPQATMVPIAKIRTFLETYEVPTAPAQSGIEYAKAAAVRVICVRK